LKRGDGFASKVDGDEVFRRVNAGEGREVRGTCGGRGGGFRFRACLGLDRGGRGDLLFLKAEEEGADGDLVAGDEPNFVDQAPVDPKAVEAAEVADHHAVVGQGQAAVPAGDFRDVDPDVAVGVTADQEDRALEGDDRGRAGVQGHKSGGHISRSSAAGAADVPSSKPAAAGSGIWTMTWIRQRSATPTGSIPRTAAASRFSLGIETGMGIDIGIGITAGIP
jgi:hypothetical protein